MRPTTNHPDAVTERGNQRHACHRPRRGAADLLSIPIRLAMGTRFGYSEPCAGENLPRPGGAPVTWR
jgi:hypothetical protein